MNLDVNPLDGHTERRHGCCSRPCSVDDADTTTAVCGQIAGAFYGEQDIPPKWIEKLALIETIRRMADSLFERSN
jgi:hypothetical protein